MVKSRSYNTPKKFAFAAAGGLGIFLLSRLARASNLPSFPLAPGFAMTVWNGNGVRSAWNAQRSLAEQIKPQIIQFHLNYGETTDLRPLATEALRIVPNMRFWIEIATDPAMQHGAQGAIDTAKRAVESIGAEATCWNAENRFKEGPASARMARAIIEGWARSSRVVQGNSAYAQPMSHSQYCWAAWFGGRDYTGTFPGGVAFALDQVYPFGDGQTGPAEPGALIRSLQRSRASWAEAQQAGIVRAGVPHALFMPSRFIATQELVQVGNTAAVSTMWPWSGVYDPNALEAAKQLAMLRR
jgi:hypothetical protein